MNNNKILKEEQKPQEEGFKVFNCIQSMILFINRQEDHHVIYLI